MRTYQLELNILREQGILVDLNISGVTMFERKVELGEMRSPEIMGLCKIKNQPNVIAIHKILGKFKLISVCSYFSSSVVHSSFAPARYGFLGDIRRRNPYLAGVLVNYSVNYTPKK